MSNGELGLDLVLMAACADVVGKGGLYGWSGRSLERIDPLNSSSVAVAGSQLARLLWSLPGEPAHLLIYGEHGLAAHHELRDLGDAHQVVFDGTDYVLVSTATNTLVWLSPSGRRREWKAGGSGDAWHLNGVCFKDGALLGCAFGRFADEQGWRTHAQEGTGIVFDVVTGQDVLTDLCCPHHPLWLGDAWVVCNSAAHEILEIDAEARVRRRLNLGAWTRGVAVLGDYLFVGLSAPRHDVNNRHLAASIACVSLRSWELLDRIPVPSQEIGDLTLVPAALVEAVRQAAPEVAGMELQMLPLEPLAGAAIDLWPVQVPCIVPAGSEFHCTIRVENRSGQTLQSIAPNPVCGSYHWMEAVSGNVVVFDGVRTPLPRLAAGGAAAFAILNVKAPERPGKYTLQLTLVQESVRWFDEPPAQLRSDLPLIISPAVR